MGDSITKDKSQMQNNPSHGQRLHFLVTELGREAQNFPKLEWAGSWCRSFTLVLIPFPGNARPQDS